MKQPQKRTDSPIIPLIWAGIIVLAASLPYIAGILFQKQGVHFVGFTYNIDDACVYTSWIRQIADGSIFVRNQFTTAPQAALQFNLFFVVLGLISRLMHLSPVTVFHLSRIVLGIALLMLIWKFSARFLKDPDERKLIVPLVGLASGLGWMMLGIGDHRGPVDIWQPEAITFLSIYLNPLFLIGLILMISSVHFLLKMQDTGSWKDGALAGLMLLILGNVHTYDVLTVGVVWASYMVVEIIRTRSIQWRTIGLSAMAALISLPALAYQYYQYSHVEAFRQRVESQTPSPALWAYLMGFGILLVLSIIGGHIARTERRDVVLLTVWSIVGFAIPYAPVAQQRKLVMGLQIPIAILAAIAVAAIAKRIGPKYAGIATILLIAVMIPSNLCRMGEDVNFLSANATAPGFRAYLTSDEIHAMDWLRVNTKRDDAVLAFPDMALHVPAMAGNQVYYGHWSETPGYADKLNEWMTFVNAQTPDSWRADFLKRSGAKYVIYFSHPEGLSISLGENRTLQVADLGAKSYLTTASEFGDMIVYRVKL